MPTPRYQSKQNKMPRQVEKSSLLRAKDYHAMFKPNLSLREYLGELVAEKKLTRAQATAALKVRSADDFQKYVDKFIS